jgi:hypothetical protein
MLKLGKEVVGVAFRGEGKLSRKNQWGAKDSFGRGKAGGIMRRGAIGQENPRQVCNPIW